MSSTGLEMRQNRFRPGFAPDLGGELTALPRPPSWWGGGWPPPPKNITPPWLFGPRASALQASVSRLPNTPKINPLESVSSVLNTYLLLTCCRAWKSRTFNYYKVTAEIAEKRRGMSSDHIDIPCTYTCIVIIILSSTPTSRKYNPPSQWAVAYLLPTVGVDIWIIVVSWACIWYDNFVLVPWVDRVHELKSIAFFSFGIRLVSWLLSGYLCCGFIKAPANIVGG